MMNPMHTMVNKTVAQISFHFGFSIRKASLKLSLSLDSGFIGDGLYIGGDCG